MFSIRHHSGMTEEFYCAQALADHPAFAAANIMGVARQYPGIACEIEGNDATDRGACRVFIRPSELARVLAADAEAITLACSEADTNHDLPNGKLLPACEAERAALIEANRKRREADRARAARH